MTEKQLNKFLEKVAEIACQNCNQRMESFGDCKRFGRHDVMPDKEVDYLVRMFPDVTGADLVKAEKRYKMAFNRTLKNEI